MRRYCRATSVNDNSHAYFELTDEMVDTIRTKHLLGLEEWIMNVPVIPKEELIRPFMLVSANTSSLYLDSGHINFLYFKKNGELVARFNKAWAIS